MSPAAIVDDREETNPVSNNLIHTITQRCRHNQIASSEILKQTVYIQSYFIECFCYLI